MLTSTNAPFQASLVQTSNMQRVHGRAPSGSSAKLWALQWLHEKVLLITVCNAFIPQTGNAPVLSPVKFKHCPPDLFSNNPTPHLNCKITGWWLRLLAQVHCVVSIPHPQVCGLFALHVHCHVFETCRLFLASLTEVLMSAVGAPRFTAAVTGNVYFWFKHWAMMSQSVSGSWKHFTFWCSELSGSRKLIMVIFIFNEPKCLREVAVALLTQMVHHIARRKNTLSLFLFNFMVNTEHFKEVWRVTD